MRVYLNDKLYRRTTEHGTLRIPTDVGAYSIRVQKDGFRSPAAQTIDLKKGEEQRVALTLVTIPPVLEISGAVPGAQVKVDGAGIGETDSNGAFQKEVAPGEHVVELTKDEYNPVRLTVQFTPGKTTRPDRTQLTMSRVIKTPDAKQIEAQDFERIRNSTNPSDFDDFVRRHSDGAHADEGRTRAAQLRQQKQTNEARQAEQAAWDGTDKTKKAAVQDYLNRFGNGMHAQEARDLIAGMDKQQGIVDQLEKQKMEAEEKLKQERAKQEDDKKRADVERTQVLAVIDRFNAALAHQNQRELKAIWQGIPKSYVDAVTIPHTLLKLEDPQVVSIVKGVATLLCNQTTQSAQSRPPQQVTVVLRNRGGSDWIIVSLAANR